MSKGLKARAELLIHAPASTIWEALTTPSILKQYFFGSDVVTDWKVGAPIFYRGVWDGKPFEDKGTVLEVRPLQRLVVTHWSPLSGLPDIPDNHHTVTYSLEERGDATQVTITQDNNASAEQAKHSAENWKTVLEGLKSLVEEA